jgi:hypothetical protein
MKSLTRKSLLCGSQYKRKRAEAVRLLTVNFSRVNCGARIDVRDVWWVSTDEPSELMRCIVAGEESECALDVEYYSSIVSRASVAATQRANTAPIALELMFWTVAKHQVARCC